MGKHSQGASQDISSWGLTAGMFSKRPTLPDTPVHNSSLQAAINEGCEWTLLQSRQRGLAAMWAGFNRWVVEDIARQYVCHCLHGLLTQPTMLYTQLANHSMWHAAPPPPPPPPTIGEEHSCAL